MANNTIQSDASVEKYLAAIADESRRGDCRALAAAKGCLYLRSFADVDAKILASLVEGAIAERKARYG